MVVESRIFGSDEKKALREGRSGDFSSVFNELPGCEYSVTISDN